MGIFHCKLGYSMGIFHSKLDYSMGMLLLTPHISHFTGWRNADIPKAFSFPETFHGVRKTWGKDPSSSGEPTLSSGAASSGGLSPPQERPGRVWSGHQVEFSNPPPCLVSRSHPMSQLSFPPPVENSVFLPQLWKRPQDLMSVRNAEFLLRLQGRGHVLLTMGDTCTDPVAGENISPFPLMLYSFPRCFPFPHYQAGPSKTFNYEKILK